MPRKTTYLAVCPVAIHHPIKPIRFVDLLAYPALCEFLEVLKWRKARELLGNRDLFHQKHESAKAGSKNQLHYLLRCQRVTELSQPVLETIARIDGSIVLDRDGNLLAFGAILRHSPVVVTPDEVAEGSRTAAAIAASQFGNVLKVSEDGRLSFYRSDDLEIQPKLNSMPLLSRLRRCTAASLQFSGDLYLAATHLDCPFPS